MRGKYKFFLTMLVTIGLFSSGGLVYASVTPDPLVREELTALFKNPKFISDCPYQNEIANAAEKYNLPMLYILSVIRGESFYKPDAVSVKGAVGLMQIMDSVAQDYKIDPDTLTDPDVNIELGSRYLADLYARFDQDPYLALGAYFCGPGGIKKDGSLNSACNNYVRYIYSHLKALTAHLETGDIPKSKENFVIGTYNYFLPAEGYCRWLSEKMPGYQFDVFRFIVREQDYFHYQYQILASGGTAKDICQKLEQVTGFNTCSSMTTVDE